jgi:RHH-type proline utilization regulon transcriptional repressor/proline dehydrogenase/delta 1-pyrroline-5-carboxylate dehydrogenase
MPLFSRKKPVSPRPLPSSTPVQTGALRPGTDGGAARAGTIGEVGGVGGDEGLIREIGRGLLQRARGHKTGMFSAKFYSDWLMEWSMKDPNFKVQMFRFVDAFPMLRDTDDIYDHLRDYLGQPGVTVPTPIAAGIKAGGIAKGLFVATMTKQIKGMAEKFIMGTDAASALGNLKDLWKDGIAFSVDLLGEVCVSDEEADSYRDKYLDLINNLPGQVAGWAADPRLESDHLGPIPRTNVSVKISALSARCDPIDTEGAMRDLMGRLEPILAAAKAKGVFVNFDMEQFAFKDFTLDLFMRCCEKMDAGRAGSGPGSLQVGLAMQAYLRSGPEDARRISEWAKSSGRVVTVRLVKGAYWDYEVINAEARGWPCPVWTTKRDTDACFERMTEIFLDATPRGGTGAPPVPAASAESSVPRNTGGTPVPPRAQGGIKLALGSHNVRSIAAAIAGLRRRGLPDNALELQMLHGMADQLKHAAAETGYRIREYVPVGQMIPGMAYLVRRLLENTSNESWLKASFLDNADPDVLLASPHPSNAPGGPGNNGVSAGHAAPHVDGADTTAPGEPGATNLDRAPERHKLSPAVGELGLRPFVNEPFRDFSKAEQRAAYAGAIARASVPRVASDRTPAQGAEMVARAARVFGAWRDVPGGDRARVLVFAGEEMRRRRDELSAVMIKESGKTWREADADTCEAIDFCDYYARTAPRMFGRERLGRFIGELDETLYEPRGVAVVISPWNFPLAICTGMTTAALVTGNAVIVKPAEQTPGIARLMFDILQGAIERGAKESPAIGAMPAQDRRDVLQFCPAPGETTGAALVRDPRVAVIAFTGSRDVGLDILDAAAPVSPFNQRSTGATPVPPPIPTHIKKVVCEMGGKNAVIVDTSADADEAVLGVRHSAFGFQGQKCSACSRLIVVDPQGPRGPAIASFVHRLTEATRALTIGDPALPGTDVGPVIDAEAKAKIEGFIARAKASGLESMNLPVPAGLGEKLGKPFVSPHIFWVVPGEHELAREEVFGPVLAVMHAPDFEAALALANSSLYKLTGGVFSRRPAHLELAKRAFRVGNLYLNRGITGALVARQPFGGFGMSGVGTKAGGADYLQHFVEPRAICENTLRRGFAPEL